MRPKADTPASGCDRKLYNRVSLRHAFPEASSNDTGSEISQLTDKGFRHNRGLEALKAEPTSLLPSLGSELLCDIQSVSVQAIYSVPAH